MEIHLENEAATRRLAEDIALALRPGDCLCLSGGLGAGKSTLARAILRAIADDDALEVPSPTFTLVQSYELRVPVGHFDLYRLASQDELDELGLDDVLAAGAALIEWPERAGDRLPPGGISIAISGSRESRDVSITGSGAFMERLARSGAARGFLDANGLRGAKRRFFQGDASSRSYERVGDGRLILMNAPKRPDGPPVRDGLPYSQIAHLAEDVTPFVAIGRWLRENGFSAPEIPAADVESGFLLVENLGGDTLFTQAGTPDPDRYAAAIDCLARLHGLNPPSGVGLPCGGSYRLPAYDARAMQIEVELLTAWYLPWKSDKAVSTAMQEEYLALWQPLLGEMAAVSNALVLRDYHSPNLIWRAEKSGLGRVGIIDFQDALIGPEAYDVASLLQDARITVPEPVANELLERYVSARRAADSGFDEEAFRRRYAIMAAQRAAKILGIFVRLDRRDGKPGYLKHLPRIENYIVAALAHPALEPLRSWFARAGITPSES